MRALVIQETAPPSASSMRGQASSVIKLVQDWPPPEAPIPGHAVIRTLASALNHLDLWVIRGVPGMNLQYPRVSGSDGCGIVEQVGEGVSQEWIGKKVMLNAAVAKPRAAEPADGCDRSLAPDYEVIGEHVNGTHAERFTAPIANLAAIPDSTDPTHAAAFGLAFLTAYSMMKTKAALSPGQRVLITGIGGGVALAALAIAKHLTCPVAVTSRHAWKLERARQLGADLAILDEGQDWSKDVRQWSGRRGVDLAVDSSGKATHLKCIKSLVRGGAYVTPGCTSGPDATTDLARIFWNQLRILGSTMGDAHDFAEVASLFRAGKLAPVIDKEFTADQGPEAFARLDAAEQFGKIVIRWA